MSTTEYPVRKHARAPGHSYRERDGYFLTLCTQDRRCFFGRGAKGAVELNVLGLLVERCLTAIPCIYPHVRLDAWVVMPEHVHLILWMDAWKEEGLEAPSRLRWGRHSLGVIMNQFKGAVTKGASRELGLSVGALWQRGYFDRVIRAGSEEMIRRYIERHRIRPRAPVPYPTGDRASGFERANGDGRIDGRLGGGMTGALNGNGRPNGAPLH